MTSAMARFSGLSLPRSTCSSVRLVKFFVVAVVDAAAGASEDASGAGVDGAEGEDAFEPAGEVVVAFGVIVFLQCDGVEDEGGDGVFVFFWFEVHAPVAHGVVHDGLAEADGVGDGVLVGAEDVSVGSALGSEQDGGGGEACEPQRCDDGMRVGWCSSSAVG